jgi:hypothetical protein
MVQEESVWNQNESRDSGAQVFGGGGTSAQSEYSETLQTANT